MKTFRATPTRRWSTATALAIVALTTTPYLAPALAKNPGDSSSPGASRREKSTKNAPAGGGNDKTGCTSAYTQAHEKAQLAHLRAARELLAKCAKVICGSFLQKECGTLYTQLEADIPSIVPLVTDDAGQHMTLVEVRMDGELLTSRLDGRALLVDPGVHEFSFSTDAEVFATRKLRIVQGQRNRTVTVKFQRGPKTSQIPPQAPPSRTASPE